MGRVRILVSALVTAGLTVTSVTPGFARDGYGYDYGNGYGHHRRRHHDRVDAGDVIAGIAIVGVIAAIASAASKPKKPRYSRNAETDYPQDYDRRSQQSRGSINSENAAVDACAAAAEDRGGQTASVREISTVDANNDGWDIEGIVEQRGSWRDRTRERKRFTCSIRFGSLESIAIDGNSVALR